MERAQNYGTIRPNLKKNQRTNETIERHGTRGRISFVERINGIIELKFENHETK